MKEGQLITGEWLQSKGACISGVYKFNYVFPNGAKLTRRNLRKAVREHLDVSWLTSAMTATQHKQFWKKYDAVYDRYRARMSKHNKLFYGNRAQEREYEKIRARKLALRELETADLIADILKLK